MEPSQTLHDFVLSLLSDPAARAEFELDPEAALEAAGLRDITAADVREVVPLVVDYAPIQGITGLDGLPDLGLGALDGDPTAAIRQLQSVTQLTAGAHSTSGDPGIAALGAITVDSGGYAGLGAQWSVPLGSGGVEAEVHLPDGLSATNDLARTLDSDLVSPVVGETGGVVDTANDVVTGVTTGGLLGTVDVTTNTVTGLLPVDLPVDPPLVGSLGAGSSLLTNPVQQVEDTVQGLGVGVGDVGLGGSGLLTQPGELLDGDLLGGDLLGGVL